MRALHVDRRLHDAEQGVHLLQTQALGFFNEEDREDDDGWFVCMLAPSGRDRHTRIEDGKHQKRPPADILHRNRYHLADAVVERPLRAGRHGHAVLADAVGIYFAGQLAGRTSFGRC